MTQFPDKTDVEFNRPGGAVAPSGTLDARPVSKSNRPGGRVAPARGTGARPVQFNDEWGR